MMCDRLARPQPAHHGHAFPQALVTLALHGPALARDVLVERFAAADGEPEPFRIHLTERRRSLGDNRRVIPPAGRVHAAEGQTRRLERGTEPRPRETALPLLLNPRVEVVRAHGSGEARLLGEPHIFKKLARRVLLVRAVIAETHHRSQSPEGLDRPDLSDLRLLLARRAIVADLSGRIPSRPRPLRNRFVWCRSLSISGNWTPIRIGCYNILRLRGVIGVSQELLFCRVPIDFRRPDGPASPDPQVVGPCCKSLALRRHLILL